MQADDKSPCKWTSEHEEDITSPVLRDVASGDHAVLLQLRMRELVRAKLPHLFCLASSRAFRLASNIVQVVLVCVELRQQIRVVVTNRLVHIL